MKFAFSLKPVLALTLAVVTNASAQKAVTEGVPSANPRQGVQQTVVAPGFSLIQIAEGSEPIENPSGSIVKFGLLSDGTKTEPDENTYVVFESNPGGPDASFDYGRHFLYQGHENGGGMAYVTRVNLDITDAAHRITLLTPVGLDGKTGLSSIDGSTWNPFTRTMLFTQEAGASGGVIEITVAWPPVVSKLDGIMGQGGYEGVHIDKRGNVYLVEDAGGTSVNTVPGDTSSPKTARRPNSFVYRFVPNDVADLSKGGKLRALQVVIDGAPVVFGADASADTFSTAQLQLDTVGTTWPTKWITIHDTSLQGFAAFNANALAKTAGATPFKRPENMAFLPGSGFNTFFFDATGDTDAQSGAQPALAARAAWGAIYLVDFPGIGDFGTISAFYLGDSAHASFDNLTFADNDTLLAAEDRGDSLHDQLNLLDSIWAFDTRHPGSTPVRFVALGRDPLSYADVLQTGEGDNEPTGVTVSDGRPGADGLLGKNVPPATSRWFFTQQHGMNVVYEVKRAE